MNTPPISRRALLTAAITLAALRPQAAPPTNAAADSPKAGYDSVEAVSSRLSGRALSAMEGVWEMSADGAVIAIEREADASRQNSATYSLIVIYSPDRAIAPGTVMGHANDTSSTNRLEARVYTKVDGDGNLSGGTDFILELKADGRLALNGFRRGIYVNLWKLVPYMFRHSVGYRDERPTGTDGLTRVYPPDRYATRYL